MNIALIGYGRMGHEIEEIAIKRGHKIPLIIDVNNIGDLNTENLSKVDVAIEFSSPDSAFENCSKCLEAGVPVVSGTTAWQKDYDKAAAICVKNNTSFIQSSNFSIGVNLFFHINRELAKKIKDYSDYSVSVEEIHHTKKLDAPSGTAITTANRITEGHPGYSGWSLDPELKPGTVPIKAIREGNVPGTHIVSWDSHIDTITLRHEAKNRKGFALGAVVAAEFIHNKRGVFTMSDVLGF